MTSALRVSLCSLVVAAACLSCAQARTIIDAMGRSVEIPDKVERLVCTGTGALRVATYLNGDKRLVGIESSDKRYETNILRDYAHSRHAEFKKLPVIGKGGGRAYTANPEALLTAAPDVILTGYSPEAVKQLERETGLPVVSVLYRSINFVDDSFIKSLNIAADVLGEQARAKELIDYIAEVKADLAQRASRVDPATRPSVYPAAVTYSGVHGFTGTYSNFGPLTAVGAKNVSDRADREGFYEADAEQILKWNPDVIFVDPGSLHLVQQEYKTRTPYFESLQAVRNNRVYSMPSFNQYSTNITYCLMNAYWAGKVLSPEVFADVDFEAKMNEVLVKFLGKSHFDKMAKSYDTLSLK